MKTEKSEQIKKMFDEIAKKYDIANNILSFGRHYSWKKYFIKQLGPTLGNAILDVATGTGDLAFAFAKALDYDCTIKGVDFSEVMIEVAKSRNTSNCIEFKIGDATKLDFATDTFDFVTITFGIRNIPEIEKAIAEMTRVLKSGGKLGIMEFGTPDAGFYGIYKFYAKYIMPAIGKLLTKHPDAYTYLPQTSLEFPYGKRFVEIMQTSPELKNINFTKLQFGVVYIYIAEKG
ncbi:MAG: bifunctional demethylmenaquinone methyltransferase/2-methoxy-6-polyprenyl-1,4-benzoquinol methylase UbiE [Desulfobulbaceae bacterium]|nr:bifunctional demethylmenaquinone methyltransferase/2-methoxy-6-polyprenyl-1,4-benzoquinol methylase UbiE [Candidatus Kapabacteria bacterium]MBS4000276.1 bifunctional demethylmenaquinone methyltransferase/2-methoxy-6-polyprenyl-1,4-benzoquinol methylase UbiE [Desulfobulbaceae bacterium]